MTVFASRSYQSYLKKYSQAERGNLTALAKATECQPSYLLRVFNEQAHITPDQAHRLCKFWGFDADESDYFMTLVNHARASDSDYRLQLQKKLATMIKDHDNLQKVVQRDEADETQRQLRYHADWRTCAVHFLTDCPTYHTKDKLAARVGLTTPQLEEILRFLSECGLVDNQKRTARFKSGTGHIPRGSAVLPIFQSSWRQLAMQESLVPNDQSVHFTNVQTISLVDLPKLIEAGKKFIQTVKEICEKSGTEDVVAVNLDIFRP